VVQENIRRLQELGYSFVGPKVGRLATGIEGRGPLADADDVVRRAEELLGEG
jgi:phosphopantothenoylcysteine synthetase/decarboxylase